MEEKRPDAAVDLLRNSYSESDKHLAYGMWKSALHHIRMDEKYRNFFLYDQIEKLASEATSREDQSRLHNLNLLSTNNICNIIHQHNSRPYLIDLETDMRLKQLKPMAPEYYEFVLPQDYIDAYVTHIRARDDTILNREAAPSEDYVMTKEERNRVVGIARGVIMSSYQPLQRTKDYVDLLNALMVVTGRRSYEVAQTMSMEPVEGFNYQANFSGLQKKSEAGPKPILIAYPDVDRCLGLVRDYRTYESNRAYSSRMSSAIAVSAKRLWGRKIAHSHKRNIYVDEGFDDREYNKFYPNLVKQHWAGMALGHVVRLRVTDRYQLMSTA